MSKRCIEVQVWSYPVQGVSVVVEVRGYAHGDHSLPPQSVLVKLALEDAIRRIKGFEPRYPFSGHDEQARLPFGVGNE